MATGDMRNNVGKLLREIRRMNLNVDIDTSGWCVGTPASFLPVLHSALMEYSLPVSQWLVSRDCTLYGKSDLRFLEGLYRILRTAFNYHPKLNIERFLATGYAERKIIFVYDVLMLCQKKHKELTSEKRRSLVNAEGYGCKPRAGVYGRHCEVLSVKDRRGLGSAWTENVPVTTCVEPQENSSHTPNHSPLQNESVVIVRHKSPVPAQRKSSIHIPSGSPSAYMPSEIPVYTSPAPRPRSPSVTISPPPQSGSPEVLLQDPRRRFSADITMSPTTPACDCESHLESPRRKSTSPNRGEGSGLTDDIDKSTQDQCYLNLNNQVNQLANLVEQMSTKFVLMETELTLARAWEESGGSQRREELGGQRREELGGQRREELGGQRREELGGQRREELEEARGQRRETMPEMRKEVRKEVRRESSPPASRPPPRHTPPPCRKSPPCHTPPPRRKSPRHTPRPQLQIPGSSPDPAHSTRSPAPISITPTISTPSSPLHHAAKDETQQLIANLRNRALSTKLFLQQVITSNNIL